MRGLLQSVSRNSAPVRCVPVNVGDLAAMVAVVQAEQPELTVMGPELPLSLGVVDELTRLRVPRVWADARRRRSWRRASRLPRSLCGEHEIPTAAYAVCTTLDEVVQELPRFSVPVVVKADGLAAGKGVVICQTHLQAEQAAAEMFSGALLGAAETEL